jgi:hypothetical protein
MARCATSTRAQSLGERQTEHRPEKGWHGAGHTSRASAVLRKASHPRAAGGAAPAPHVLVICTTASALISGAVLNLSAAMMVTVNVSERRDARRYAYCLVVPVTLAYRMTRLGLRKRADRSMMPRKRATYGFSGSGFMLLAERVRDACRTSYRHTHPHRQADIDTWTSKKSRMQQHHAA